MTKKHCIIALCAFLLALIICAGLALAAAITQPLHVNFYEPGTFDVSPSTLTTINVPYGGSGSQEYVITNTSPVPITVTVTAEPVEGVSVTFLPEPSGVFTLDAADTIIGGGADTATVNVTVRDDPLDGYDPPDTDISLTFTAS